MIYNGAPQNGRMADVSKNIISLRVVMSLCEVITCNCTGVRWGEHCFVSLNACCAMRSIPYHH